jgi:hypothetical protein
MCIAGTGRKLVLLRTKNRGVRTHPKWWGLDRGTRVREARRSRGWGCSARGHTRSSEKRRADLRVWPAACLASGRAACVCTDHTPALAVHRLRAVQAVFGARALVKRVCQQLLASSSFCASSESRLRRTHTARATSDRITATSSYSRGSSFARWEGRLCLAKPRSPKRRRGSSRAGVGNRPSRHRHLGGRSGVTIRAPRSSEFRSLGQGKVSRSRPR